MVSGQYEEAERRHRDGVDAEHGPDPNALLRGRPRPVVDVARAEARAEALLLSLLDAAQAEAYREAKSFVVRADSGRRYRINLGVVGNILEIDEAGRPKLRLCVHPNGLPIADVVAAQKLMLDTDEDSFRRLSNITDIATGRLVHESRSA